MKTKYFIIIFISLLIAFYAGKEISNFNSNPKTNNPGNSPTTNESSGNERAMDIESYVRMNISELAPEKEALGGTFYVTEIQTEGGKGTVSYEDGHNAYTAEFTYTTDEIGRINIASFKLK